MLTFRIVVLWIHLAGVIAWVGGMIAIPFVVAPYVRRLLPERADELVERLVLRFQRLSRELIFVILLSGIFNVINAGVMTGFSYGSRYLQLVGVKLVLFLGMVGIQLWYSLVLVPSGKGRRAGWAAAAHVVLAGVVVYVALTLRYG
ncbi:MAG: hypothetical protein WD021_03215 [Rhodothermales bacterium]